METDVNIVPPTEGEVTLTLSYEDAEIVTRLLGLANFGSLRAASPHLAEMVATLTDHYGRNFADEARRWTVRVHNDQAYLNDIHNPPF